MYIVSILFAKLMLHRSSIINNIVINIMIIEVMNIAKSLPRFVDFRPRDVIASSLAGLLYRVSQARRTTYMETIYAVVCLSSHICSRNHICYTHHDYIRRFSDA